MGDPEPQLFHGAQTYAPLNSRRLAVQLGTRDTVIGLWIETVWVVESTWGSEVWQSWVHSSSLPWMMCTTWGRKTTFLSMSPPVEKGALLPTQESHGGENPMIDDNGLRQQTMCRRREMTASDHIANLGFCCGLFCFCGLFYFGERRKKFFKSQNE